MSENSKIEWTDHTFNPWWGCVKVSAACTNCYAERDAHRYSPDVKLWGPGSERRFFGPNHWHEPRKWNSAADKLGIRKRVFCASMADVFEDFPRQESALKAQRARLWDLIETTPSLDWLLLTKRPENIMRMIPESWQRSPRRNVWFGTTVERDDVAVARIRALDLVPAAVKFLSIEPLLGALDLGSFFQWSTTSQPQRINWVIVGGESGPHARPMNPNWVTKILTDCQRYRVPFFFKQWGEFRPAGVDDPLAHAQNSLLVDGEPMMRVGKKAAGRMLFGQEWNELPTVAR